MQPLPLSKLKLKFLAWSIFFESSINGIVVDNFVSNNEFKGIRLSSSRNTSHISNNIYSNKDGIYIESSPNCILEGNSINNNNLSGIYIKSSLNCMINNNSLINTHNN